MAWFDWICPALMISAFVAAVPWGRRVWWFIDSAASATFGLGLIFVPQFIMGFQVDGKLDQLHLQLCRIIGAIMIGSAASYYLCRNSTDERMFSSQLFSRVVCTFVLIAQAYSTYHLWNRPGQRFNDKYIAFSFLGSVLWLLGSLAQLIRSNDYGGYIHKTNKVHIGLLMDSFLLLVLSVICFSFTSQFIKLMVKPMYKIDGIHVCLFRTAAAMLLGQSWISNASQSFLYMDDKRAHIAGRLLVQILAFLLSANGHFWLKLFTVCCITPFTLLGFYVTFLIWLYFRTIEKRKED